MKLPLPAYTSQLREEIQRTRQTVRGHNGLAAQSGLPASRLDDITNGAAPTDPEHRAICRGLPRMRHYQNLLVEFRSVALGAAAAAPPAPSAPALPSRAAIPPALLAPSVAPAPQAAPTPPAPVAPPPLPLTLVPRTFPEWLRAAREREGLTIEELGTLLELSASAVRAWEDDVSTPVEDNYRRLVKLLPVVAEGPKPASRDIPKPIGRTSGDGLQAPPPPRPTLVESVPIASPAAPATHQRELITFGIAVGRAAAAIEDGRGARAAVVALLRQGDAAGLHAAEIADAIESVLAS